MTATEQLANEMPHNPERSDRVVVHLPKALTAAVDAYRKRKMIGTRSDAIRRLITAGLEVEKDEPKRQLPWRLSK